MRFQSNAKELNNSWGGRGLEIAIEGYEGDPNDGSPAPTQVFIEFYEGKLWVRVWNGSSEEPIAILIPKRPIVEVTP